MGKTAHRHMRIVGLAVAALVFVGCSNGKSADTSAPAPAKASATSSSPTPAQPAEVKIVGVDNVEVTLTGPIAAKYVSATEAQKASLGKALTGDHNAGTRQSGLVFQQFENGVITAKDDQAGTPAYITSGKIRDAWNVQRDAQGLPAVTGSNGSAGPLGFPTSDVTTVAGLQVASFEHGKIEYRERTDQIEVTVNGKVVPAGL